MRNVNSLQGLEASVWSNLRSRVWHAEIVPLLNSQICFPEGVDASHLPV